MKKVLVLLVLLLALTGCDGSASIDVSTSEIIRQTDGLSDCKAYEVSTARGSMLYVIRCPNSSTSINRSKGQSVTVIDNNAVMDSDHAK